MELPVDDLAQRHLARVVESSDDAIVSKDLNGIIISWNKAAERMFGYTAAEAVGRSIRIIIPADRQAEEDMVLARVRAGQGLSHFETVRQRKDGTQVQISLTVSPIHNDAGQVIGASKIARDVTDETRAIAASRLLAAVVESSDDAIVAKDLQSIITSWNPAAERMFGYTEAEAIGRSVRMLIPTELQAEEDEVLASIRAGQKVDHYETTRQRKDGSRLRVSLTVSPIRNQHGEVVGASKVARDITERARLLALAEEHASTTQKLSDVGAVITSTLDRESILQKVTDIATELTHAQLGAFFYHASGETLGAGDLSHTVSGGPDGTTATLPAPDVAGLFAPPFPTNGPVRLDDLRAESQSVYADALPTFASASGALPVHSCLAVPVRGVNGEVLGGLFFGHADIGVFTTQHERLALGMAAWAGLALENARLYAEAQAANRIKDEFLAVLSHELRTPLNAIVGYSRLLRGNVLTAEKAERGLETLERNATWLTQIVEDVLDVSRIVSGKLRLEVQPVELPLLIDNAVATVQPAADAKGVVLRTVVETGVRPVSGDAGRLQQVVWNLVSNAVKYTPRNGRVQVRLAPVDAYIDIIVSDTGAGIDPAFLPHVFERFRQADTGTTRKAGGLGLGLSIVRHIVEMHGGTVEASSGGEGQGATFRVRLPSVPTEPTAVRPRREHPQAQPRAPLAGLEDLRGIHVVAIDDEEDARTLLRVVLEAAGARVTTVSSSGDALDRIGEVRPDVLVIDLGMPGMDGFELITRIRQSADPRTRALPAAALTAFARPEERTRSLRCGFEMHLAKPADPGELVASVATLARRSGHRR